MKLLLNCVNFDLHFYFIFNDFAILKI